MTGALDADTPGRALAIALSFGRSHLWAVPDPAREVRILLAHALGVDVATLPGRPAEAYTAEVMARFYDLIERRQGGTPMSHLLGYRDFWKSRFLITPDVLDPRPETETLVEVALQAPFERVLDLGTGSGCIAISLLLERPEAVGLATDLSPDALAVARRNAEAQGVADRLDLGVSDWWSGVEGRFDLIVSNPPYIAASEMERLQREVRDHEPRIALTDDADGLSAYRAIAGGVLVHLTPGGRLLVEIGHRQGAAVSEIFRAAGLEAIAVHPDLDGRDRVVAARAPGA